MAVNPDDTTAAAIPAPTSLRITLTETIMLAVATATIYMMTSAYQVGFQNQFGFTYLNIGVEDITFTIRYLLIPVLLGVLVAIAMAFLLSLLGAHIRASAFLLAPPLIMLSFWLFYDWDWLREVSREVWWLLAAYYVFDFSLIGLFLAIVPALKKIAPTEEFSRMMQILIGAAFLVVLSFDLGRREAVTITRPEICVDPNGKLEDQIMLQRSGDLVICARVDWANKIVFADFTYFKLDAKTPMRFKLIDFHPSEVGRLPPS